MKCKYAKKANLGKKYIKCECDGSIRTYPCHCVKEKPTLFGKLKLKLGL